MRAPTRNGVVDRLSEFDPVVEIGIGRRPAVARGLVERGITVTATDIRSQRLPAGIDFVRDDIREPTLSIYEGAEALYALNLPPELHRTVATLADRVGSAFLFTTLGSEQPTVSVTRETVPGDTIFVYDAQRA